MNIDRRVYELYDEYCHGGIDRREFLLRAAALCAGGLAMAQALLPRYALAQTISFTDTRIKANYVSYPSPGGNSGTMRGYLVQPAGNGPFPAVLVIHENRGLNPYIESDERINAMWPAYESALKTNKVSFEKHTYPGTQHGFHNNSTPRYSEAAAKLSWERTVAFFKKQLA